ncbi:MAG: cobalamin-dependent protein [Pirellulales bacterium]|nr:cobalamin-dependent protein [Pirellulales bacterium]
MNVALIFPRFKYPSGDPPLGVAYLAARLRQRTGITPRVVDTTFARDPMAMLEQVLREDRFELVGISTMISMARDSLAVARLVKQHQPHARVLIGGPQATLLPEHFLADPAVDAVAVGEAEETLSDVVEQDRLEGIPGLWVSNGGQPQAPVAREPIADLDALPFPALDLLPMEDYFASWFQLDTVRPGLRGAPVLAGRGCPFRCAFCQPMLNMLFGAKVRKRSPGNLADEIEWLKERFGINAFLFTDDTFIVDPRWGRAVCEELQRRKLDLVWGCNFRPDLADRDLFDCMVAAGARKIYMGVECYSDTTRCEILNKGVNRLQIAAAVAAARASGLRIQCYFMLGAPTETRQDVRDTIRYARRLDIDDVTFGIATPMPGTLLLEKYRGDVTIEPDDMDYYKRFAFRPRAGLDQRYLRRAQFWGYVGFYLRPFRIRHLTKLLLGRHGLKRMWLKVRRLLG